MVICSIQLVAQNYQKLMYFKGYNPLWQHISIDKKASSLESGRIGLNFPFAVPDKNGIYVIYDENERTFIEKLNAESGELEWSTGIGRYSSMVDTSGSVRENATYGFINEGGNLELLGFREHESKINQFDYIFNSFSRSIFDSTNGTLLRHIYPPEYDTMVPALTYFSQFFVTSYLFPLADGEYIYVSSKTQMSRTDTFGYRPDTMDIYSYILDSIGYKKSENFININKENRKYKFNYIDAFREKGNEEVWTILHNYNNRHYNNDTFKNEYYLLVFDKYMNILKDEKLNIDRSNNYYATIHVLYNDRNLMAVQTFDSSYNQVYFFDYNGKLLLDFPLDISDRIKHTRVRVTKLKEGGYLIVGSTMNSKEPNLNNILFFIKVKLTGEIEVIKEIQIKPKNNFIIPQFVYQLDNGNIVLGGRHQYYKFFDGYNLSGSWGEGDTQVVLCFDAASLGLKTSTTDMVKLSNKIKLYPNPANSVLNIELKDKIFGKAEIKNILGQKVLSQAISGEKTEEVDVSGLLPGMYFVSILNDKGIVCGTAKFLKE